MILSVRASSKGAAGVCNCWGRSISGGLVRRSLLQELGWGQRRGCTAIPCGRDLGDTVPEPKRVAATPWFSVLPLSVTATAATQVQVQRNRRKRLSSGHASTSSLGRGSDWQRSRYHAPPPAQAHSYGMFPSLPCVKCGQVTEFPPLKCEWTCCGPLWGLSRKTSCGPSSLSSFTG